MMFWRVHLYSKSDEIKQLKNDEQLAKVNKDKMKVRGIYLNDDDMLPIYYDEYVIMMRVKVMRMQDIEPYDEDIHNKSGSDDKETYNKSDIDETGCNKSENDDESEGGKGADAAKMEITAMRGMVYCLMEELRTPFIQ